MISASEARKKAYDIRILTIKDEVEKAEELISKSAGEGRNRCEVYVKEKAKADRLAEYLRNNGFQSYVNFSGYHEFSFEDIYLLEIYW